MEPVANPSDGVRVNFHILSVYCHVLLKAHSSCPPQSAHRRHINKVLPVCKILFAFFGCANFQLVIPFRFRHLFFSLNPSSPSPPNEHYLRSPAFHARERSCQVAKLGFNFWQQRLATTPEASSHTPSTACAQKPSATPATCCTITKKKCFNY